MPSQRYLRWNSSSTDGGALGEEDDPHGFPDLDNDDGELDFPSGVEYEGGSTQNTRVMAVTTPRTRRGFASSRRSIPLPVPMFGHTQVTSKTVCLVALSCALCITLGMLLGYAFTGHRHPIHEGSDSLPSFLSSTNPPPLRFGGRDFTKETAVHLQSHLTQKMVNAYTRRLNRIPEGQLVDYVSSTLRYQGFNTRTLLFSATVSTPDSNRPNTVELLHRNGTAELVNEPVLKDGGLPYAAYSPAGTAQGRVVYGHTGSARDLDLLQEAVGSGGLRGTIILLRHASDAEAAQVARAEAAGAVGVLLYPDPALFGGSGIPFPNGTGLPDDGVVFPNVKRVPGDPSTVHYPSLSHVYKKLPSNLHDLVPSIPVQPISYRTARVLLEALGRPDNSTLWTGAETRSTDGDADDHVDPSATTNAATGTSAGGDGDVSASGRSSLGGANVVTVRLKVHNILRERGISNVHAWLPCKDSSKVIHIGAGQGSSGGAGVGLASLLAIAESLARSMPNGTGRRILLSAWADSRQGWLGSTEFTELYGTWLEHTALAYLDLGSSVSRLRGLRVQASPLLHEAIREAAHYVAWPQQEALSVAEGWRMGGGMEYDVAFENLGCSSDAVSFSASSGVPSAQFSVAQPVAPAACAEGACEPCYDRREEHPWSLTQYDTTAATVLLLDPGLDWSTAMASLVGVTSLVLSESPLPPVDFKGDFSGSLVDGWWSFLHYHLPALNHTQYNFTEILDAIRTQLYVLQTEMEELGEWYKRRADGNDPYLVFRHDEDRVQAYIQLSRQLLGPRGVARVFTTALVGPSDLPEDPFHSSHTFKEIRYRPISKRQRNVANDTAFEYTNNAGKRRMLPEDVLATQTSNVFSNSPYNNLAFSSYYREDEKPRPHTWFPHVSQALTRALQKGGSCDALHRELSLILSALTSFRNLIPSLLK